MSKTISTAGRMSQPVRVPISALPLPPPTQRLPRNLTPDPETPSPAAWREVLAARPSIQRRARILASEAHFSFVSPCPQPFPFPIPPPADGTQLADADKPKYIENWLAQREALTEVPCAPVPENAGLGDARELKKYVSEKRDDRRELLALSEGCLRDCFPRLDVGDAFDTLGAPALALPAPETNGVPEKSSGEDDAVRQELIDVLSGHAMLMNTDGDPETHWAPWSLRYSGHQFGVWAGQLGDGRAISIISTPHPDDPKLTYELQLKGAGRTPFSRGADGLAVTRSSIREFLCSEAMNALGIPTTRALSLVSLPELPVYRETVVPERAAIVARAAPSFLRIGCFEALAPPQGVFFIGMGQQQEADWDALRRLGEWVARLLGIWDEAEARKDGERKPWAKDLVLEVARRNAKMVAGWQAYGFMHGVINTDNVSVLGLTIDYGPYAFMDVFDPWHICNHTDEEGRYAYKAQPTMIVFALRALLNSLAPLVGYEAHEGHAIPPDWSSSVTAAKLSEWRDKGMQLKEEMERIVEEVSAAEYGKLMHHRLALRKYEKEDETRIISPLLDLLGEHKLDFHGTFRLLATFRPSLVQEGASAELAGYISTILSLTGEPQFLNREKAAGDARDWLQRYAARIESERGEWAGAEGHFDEARAQAARAANPRFVLRQWVLEEIIKKVESDAEGGKRIIRKVLQMACSPFEPWGAEDFEGDESSLDPEVREERRFCSLGERKMLGFQCSCSS
ncbi:hypothetical protein CERSUDRAFT_117594 [Gelatoporia subvermispora B]|uniref:Selenoprotein O n=1 Tax=Ceriporiopsis subvermispora (strain B) TaxID=914234 RepID=M2PE09_CERS8|nr:hypothetical protein CERSUDRAFT_117594 [Gelatoporia subvermispora B]